MKAPKLAARISAGQGHNYSQVAVDGKLLRYVDFDIVGRKRELQVTLRGDRFVLSGGKFGEHSLAADESITSAARLLAHWNGYVKNTVPYYTEVVS